MLRVVLLSEYLRTVKTKAYWLTTLLTPLVLVGGAGLFALFATEGSNPDGNRSAYRLTVFGSDERTLAALVEALGEGFSFVPAAASLEDALQTVLAGKADALIDLPGHPPSADDASAVKLYVRKQPQSSIRSRLRQAILHTLRDVRLAAFDLPAPVRAAIEERPDFAIVRLAADGEQQAGNEAALLACAGALALMFVVMFCGGNVMQMAMEEKASRMAEIIVSSVRPFELMLGKILAATMLAFTQLLLWMALGAAFGSALFLAGDPDGVAELAKLAQEFQPPTNAADDAASSSPHTPRLIAAAGAAAAPSPHAPRLITAAALALALLPVGILLHASIFAALGAMFEQTTSSQNAVFVGMLPAFGSIALAIVALTQEGGAALAFGAFFPFSSPAMLPARLLAGDMPAWQVVVSLALLVATTAATVWLAGRVFRGSLLMVGKTPTLRDLRGILFE